jgi:DNA-binding XRE family transcriptional regulator
MDPLWCTVNPKIHIELPLDIPSATISGILIYCSFQDTDMQTLADVGQALQQARLQKRLSQEELAQRAGVARVTLSRMETAAKTDMSLAALLRLARALGYELKLVERGRQRTLSDVLAEQQRGEEL